MKTVYTTTKTWALGLAICCLAVVGSLNTIAAPGGVANDDCSNAIAVTCGSTTTGTTVGATADAAGTCTTTNTAPGVWYTFTGDGSTVTASLCTNTTYDTKLSVYTGSCGAFTCVTGNDDNCGLQSQVGFNTLNGETYYILVHGFSSSTGAFELNLTCAAPANDVCASAVSMTCPQSLVASNSASTATDAPDCAAGNPGTWYSFVGDGSNFTVSLVSASTDFDTYLSITEACSGVCVASNDDAVGVQSEISAFPTVNGTVYSVYVSGFAGSTGNYEISIGCASSAIPANDLCADAIALNCGDVVSGTTTDATTDAAETGATCGTSVTAPGVWYTVAGTGLDITASLCTNTSYDSKISIFEGACGSLTCVGGNDDFCGLQSEITWTSTEGTVYYVFVHGFSSGTGDFELAITCAIPANDLCADAESIVCGQTVSGVTTTASVNAPGTCVTTLATARGVWYAFAGNGEEITMTTCNPGTNYDTKLGVFSGDCNALVCVTGNDDQSGTFDPACNSTGNGFNRASTVTFNSVTGTMYYVYVSGFGTSASSYGSFELSVSCVCLASATISGGGAICPGETAPMQIDFTGTAPFDFTADIDGNQLSLQTSDNPFIVPATNPGTYTLVSMNDANCVGTTSGSGVVTMNPAPSATISGGGVACNGGTVDLSIALTGTGPWDLELADGNGGTLTVSQTSDNPTVIATDVAGTYTVTTVTDALCTAAGGGASATVTVADDPVAGFTWVQTPGSLDVQFTSTSTGPASVYGWDLGDQIGTSSDPNPAYTYAAPGEYEVIHDASNACNQDSYSETIVVVPTNDLCANAIDVACGSTTSGDFLFATADNTGCASDVGPGVWYHIVGTGDLITASTCGSSSDTELSIHEGACGSLTCVGGNDDACGLQSEFAFASTLGTDYYIFVGYWSATSAPADGAFDLSITCAAPPLNDDVCSPLPLSMGANGPFTNVGATAQSGEVVPGAGTGTSTCESQDGWCSFELGLDNTIWFTFVAPPSGNVIIDTDGSDDDTQLAVYSAVSCQDLVSGTAVLVAANDDNPDWVLTNFSSLVNICGLNPGETYFVQVDGYAGASGDVLVNLSETTVDADFTYAATGLSVDFTDASTSSSSVVDWVWDFGDGDSDVVPDPTHVYAVEGPYTVCLTVTDENGCSSTYCESIQVTDIPTTIAEAVENGMQVYPNPSNGQFIVTVRGVEADVQIIVMDVAGRQVYTEGVVLNGDFRKELNLNVAKGSYVLQIATMEGIVNRMIQIH